MALALIWLCQGTSAAGLLVMARMLAQRWAHTVERVMLYPGGAAVAAWVALQLLPMAGVLIAFGMLASSLGLLALGGFGIGVGCIVGFGSACAIGLLLPNLGIERMPFHEAM
jgi:hypothetical protein